MERNRKTGGYTLIEIIAVLVILGLLASVALPSISAYAEAGRRANRANAARMLYLAAQSSLTELRVTQGLESFAGEHHPDAEDGGTKIADLLEPLGEEQKEQLEDVHFISKPRGPAEEGDPVMALLNPVVADKIVLNDAILIEYNIKTGAVLSVFYSDVLENSAELGYTGDGSRRDVTGGRVYLHAAEREQGYYGVGSTVAPEVETGIGIELVDDQANNMLYAVIAVPQETPLDGYSLLINGDLAEAGVDFGGAADLSMLDVSPPPDGELIFSEPADAEGNRLFIWVLDYIGSDTADDDNIRHNFGVKYSAFAQAGANMTVSVRGGVSATSQPMNPYFNTEAAYGEGYPYTVASARHLYNTRYELGGKFFQLKDIDLAGIENFAPIGDSSGAFGGEFDGGGHAVKNLTASSAGDAGLFGALSGKAADISLKDPDIQGGAAGAVAGRVTAAGAVDGAYVSYSAAGVSEGKGIEGANAAGGIAGVNAGSVRNVTFVSPSAEAHVSTGGGNSGAWGIAGGDGGGTLENALYLAIAPEQGGRPRPITGENAGGADSGGLFYLSGNGIYPDTPDGGYNKGEAEGVGAPRDTVELLELGKNGTPDGWGLADGTAGLTAENALKPPGENIIYPYPFYNAPGAAVTDDWPVAADVTDCGFAYYEKYGDGTYGFWFSDDAGKTTLKDDTPVNAQDAVTVTETGYAAVAPDSLEGKFFYMMDAGDTGWIGGKRLELEGYTVTDGAAKAGMSATFNEMLGVLPRGAEWNIALIPSPEFIDAGGADAVLPVRGAVAGEVIQADTEHVMVFNPRFAKWVAAAEDGQPAYDRDRQGSNLVYIIRTPWQMQNISRLNEAVIHQMGHEGGTASAHYELRRDIDFANDTGPGVGAEMTAGGGKIATAAVTGDFHGDFDGYGQKISNVHIVANGEYGGLFEINGNNLHGVTLIASSVEGGAANVYAGALAGRNTGGGGGENSRDGGRIMLCSVEQTTVKTDGQYAGGIAGINGGVIDNTVFVYPGSPETPPVEASERAGGIIAGAPGDLSNDSNFFGLLYIAPAPIDGEGKIRPISGGDAEHNLNTYYLSGMDYRDAPSSGAETWESGGYNAGEAAGGGTGRDTAALSNLRGNITGGRLAAAGGSYGYPYPHPNVSASAPPEKWPEAKVPEQPERVFPAETEAPAALSAVSLVNGDFSEAIGDKVLRAAGGIAYWLWVWDAQGVGSVLREEIAGDAAGFGSIPNPNSTDNGNDSEWYNDVNMDAGERIYIHMSTFENGWSTRPVTRDTDYSANEPLYLYEGLIEFHEPVNIKGYIDTRLDIFMYTSPHGEYSSAPSQSIRETTSQNSRKYVEVNAQIAGTLYQVHDTVPLSQMSYSFYHSSRLTLPEGQTVPLPATNQMGFYLSNVAGASDMASESDMTLIRPCWSPRDRGESTGGSGNAYIDAGAHESNWNPDAWDTVDYRGYTSGGLTLEKYWKGKPAFNGYTWGAGEPLLYDVWIGDTETGYGITFWSGSEIGLLNDMDEPFGGSMAELLSIAPEAGSRIIGYWGVEYGWKHYYGDYTVPNGQEKTEFAFRSQSGSNEGNFLADISFSTPSHLTVHQTINGSAGPQETDPNAEPYEGLDLDIAVKAWGGIKSDNIVLDIQLSPYDGYFEVDQESIEDIAGYAEVQSAGVAEEDGERILRIVMDPSFTLQAHGSSSGLASEELVLSLRLKALKSIGGTALSTSGYHFKLQTKAGHGAPGRRKDSYSNVVQADIT